MSDCNPLYAILGSFATTNLTNTSPVPCGGILLVQVVDSNGHPTSRPDYFDITSSTTVIYEGWKIVSNVVLCKTDLTAGTRTWANDTWANHLIAIYS